MTLPRLTQRRWCYWGVRLSRRLPRPRRRAFLTAWEELYEALTPLWNFLFYARRPVLFFQVQIEMRKLRRLRAEGRTEVEL